MTQTATDLAMTALCAALYAAAKMATAFVPTPWGVGQFTPGVVVPAFFAVISGPMVGGIGAGIGVFLGDLYLSAFGLTNPFLSLIAGVPSNFAGFYLLGWLVRRFRSWSAFTWATLLSLLIGNLIAAAVVTQYISTFMGARWPVHIQMATTLGFTVFWYTTMVPFILPIVPVLVRAVSRSLGTSSALRSLRWMHDEPPRLILPSLLGACILGGLFLILIITPVGDLIFSTTVVPLDSFWLKALILAAAVIIIVFGPLTSTLAGVNRDRSAASTST